MTISAQENKGLDSLWDRIIHHRRLVTLSGEREEKRRGQQVRWMWSLVEDRLMTKLKYMPSVKALEADVGAGKITPVMAMETLLAAFSKEE